MKRLVCVATLFLLIGMVGSAAAGPEDQVAEVARQQSEAFTQGNVDGYMAVWADDAVLTTPGTPLRIEGKEAIRATITRFFQIFPTRRSIASQPTIRIFNNGTVAVRNEYREEALVDRSGQTRTQNTRFSQTLVKMGDRWLVVDQHNSRLPTSP